MRKANPEQIKTWMGVFNDEIVPFMCKNSMSLHNAFDYVRENNSEWHAALSGLWYTYVGKCYLQSFMKEYGNKLSPTKLDKIQADNLRLQNIKYPAE